jgi:CheY-like chemotaxis protein
VDALEGVIWADSPGGESPDCSSSCLVRLLDNRMPGLTGLEVAEQMLAEQPGQVIVLFSAHLNHAIEEKARAIGIAACVSKMQASRVPDIIRTLLQ